MAPPFRPVPRCSPKGSWIAAALPLAPLMRREAGCSGTKGLGARKGQNETAWGEEERSPAGPDSLAGQGEGSRLHSSPSQTSREDTPRP